ncbi:CheY-like chemotaxis protein [Spirosoma oryzae]|uniref:CheY-like chemotaxis protein n=1 Tax=Spirosoma oryzae TaxID=1469603 RepID=A0A2T0RXZ2_9BACT|nr:response regulator [Spirosoma oryzae]PRY25903.1 CheY-like chemotaxis protein [Spirosoma oryzae]
MTKTVCIVEDQADYRFIFGKLLNPGPARAVHLFESGMALLDQLDDLERRPDLILLDLHMPHQTGYQTLQRLKAHAHASIKTIPVVIMSALAEANEINECYRAGANSFLRK